MSKSRRSQATKEPKPGLKHDNPTITMLNEHIPLSLIMDLSSPIGPRSEELFHDEGDDESGWLDKPQAG